MSAKTYNEIIEGYNIYGMRNELDTRLERVDSQIKDLKQSLVLLENEKANIHVAQEGIEQMLNRNKGMFG